MNTDIKNCFLSNTVKTCISYVLTRFGHGKRHKQAKEYWSHFFLYRNLNCWRWEKTMKLIKGSDWPLYDLDSKLSCINKWHNFLLRINDRKEYRYQCCIIYPSNICCQPYFSMSEMGINDICREKWWILY